MKINLHRHTLDIELTGVLDLVFVEEVLGLKSQNDEVILRRMDGDKGFGCLTVIKK